MNNTIAIDVYALSEDERITLMTNKLRERGKLDFVVDGDRYSLGKADRYVAKIKAAEPRAYEVRRITRDLTTVTMALTDG